MQVSESSDRFEFRSPHGMKAAHSRLRTFEGIAVRHALATYVLVHISSHHQQRTVTNGH